VHETECLLTLSELLKLELKLNPETDGRPK
jgi:hypothetical protein